MPSSATPTAGVGAGGTGGGAGTGAQGTATASNTPSAGGTPIAFSSSLDSQNVSGGAQNHAASGARLHGADNTSMLVWLAVELALVLGVSAVDRLFVSRRTRGGTLR